MLMQLPKLTLSVTTTTAPAEEATNSSPVFIVSSQYTYKCLDPAGFLLKASFSSRGSFVKLNIHFLAKQVSSCLSLPATNAIQASCSCAI